MNQYVRNENCAIFRKTKEAYGGLSNMAADFPIIINGALFFTSEALYQALRYPYNFDVQILIKDEKSPMSAKMKSKSYYPLTRPDWDSVRYDVMLWCVKMKLAQNWFTFGRLLKATIGKTIVEESHKDKYWGAVDIGNNTLEGENMLGQCLMTVRDLYLNEPEKTFKTVKPLNIPDFKLFNKDVETFESKVFNEIL